MIFLENILSAFESIFSNKLRSWLSMLWIIIWVSSVIVLTAIWEWSQKAVTDQIEAMWTNVLTLWEARKYWIYSKSTAWTEFLTNNLVNDLEENISWLNWVAPVLDWNAQAVFWSNSTNASIYWINTKYFSIKNTNIEYWVNISEENLTKRDKVAVIWSDIFIDIFSSQDPIWKKIKLWNNSYEVIWVAESNWSTDSYIYIPLTTAQIRQFWDKTLSKLEISVTNSEEVTAKQEEIEDYLRNYLWEEEDEESFSIKNQASMLERMTSITWTLTSLLAWIAWISLLVWWIWVMNIMLVSVTERTREIWIRKAIWARKKDIISQFLLESSILSLIAWILWILFSYLVIFILAKFSIPWVVSVNSILMSFFFSISIWVIFWLLPAYKAAKLRPIDALRFE